MIGWIKLDKDMIDDPRVMEVAAQLRDVLHYRVVYMQGFGGKNLESNAELTALRCVTLGALVTMWRYAHDHINKDDVLPMGLDTLDTVVGIEGFCALLPAEWLIKLDELTTKLPGYCAKNSLIGKEKAASNNAQRQARYRERHKGEPKSVSAKHEAERNTGSNGVTSNAVTLADQDQDQDQDQDLDQYPKRESRPLARPRARQVPESFQVTPAMREWAARETPESDVDRETALFRDHEFKDPHSNWPACWRKWMRRAPEFHGRGSDHPAEPKLTWRPPADDPEYGAPDDVPN